MNIERKSCMKSIEEQFSYLGIIPVVVLEDVKDALPLAKALKDAGLPCAEITLRTPAAEASLQEICREYPDMLIGAGTVLTVEQVKRTADAGAKFIVSPGFDPEIVDYCQGKNIPVFPGSMTPTEVAQAVKRGLKTIKFFPAQQAGGPAMIKALSAPYPELKFMPTGGINALNLREYLTLPSVLCCGGSWMVSQSLIRTGAFPKISSLAEEARKIAAASKAV